MSVKITPPNITSLTTNQVFVFGSNTEGKHGKGAAKQAMKFGAVYGQARGMQGQTYAIVTKDLSKGPRSIPLVDIESEIKCLILFALDNPNWEFLVTKLGCGLGGYSEYEIASLFKGKILPSNMSLPKGFLNVINQESAMTLPIYEAESTHAYLQAVKEYLPVWDWEILCYRDDDPTGSFDMWDNPKSRFFKSLVHFVSLGGIIPQSVYQANREGKLFVWSEDAYGWANHLPRANEAGEWVTHEEGDKEFKPSSNLQGATILYKKLSSSERKLLNKLKHQFGLRLINLHDIYSEKVAETDVTEESIITYIKSLNGKMNEDGWWVIKFKKYTTLEVRLQNEIWYYREGTQDLVLRNYHTISGIVPVSKHSVMLAVLNFLLTSKTEEDLRGRRAFMANVFVDKIYVGYSHKLLDKANFNKVGCIQLGLSAKNHFSLLVSDGDLVRAAKAYEKLGYSVFMHKGGKYIVVEAECVGFTRNDDKTQVGWYADKHAKLTGRALFMVATAAEYIEDEE